MIGGSGRLDQQMTFNQRVADPKPARLATEIMAQAYLCVRNGLCNSPQTKRKVKHTLAANEIMAKGTDMRILDHVRRIRAPRSNATKPPCPVQVSFF
jgi:hypothetical protein